MLKFEHSKDEDFVNFVFKSKESFDKIRQVINLYIKALP